MKEMVKFWIKFGAKSRVLCTCLFWWHAFDECRYFTQAKNQPLKEIVVVIKVLNTIISCIAVVVVFFAG